MQIGSQRYRWAVVLQGIAVLTLPNNNSTKVVLESGSLVFFSDTAEASREGHGCYYPGATESVFLQIPTEDDKIPDHYVVFDDGPCPEIKYSEVGCTRDEQPGA